jgi:hypothetical protein
LVPGKTVQDVTFLSKETLSNLKICLLQQAGLRNAFVLQSRVNKGRTRDGIANIAARLVCEIEECCRENGLTDQVEISFVGHSLGGIVVRYAIYLLFSQGYFRARRFVPVSFVAIASPHLGVRRADTAMGLFQGWGGEFLYGGSKTLDELMLRDKDEAGVPLLVRMAANEFLEALRFVYGCGNVRNLTRFFSLFEITLVSAIAFDHQVTHSSSSICLYNQFDVGWNAFGRYLMSFVSSKYHDRLVGFSGFSPEYEKVLAYHSAGFFGFPCFLLFFSGNSSLFVYSAKRQDTVLEFGSLRVFLGPGDHAKRYKSHPHELQKGFPEIESSNPFVVACARGLQTLRLRRMDFEVQSMFVHDTLVASPTISCCGVSNTTKYGWKVLVKIAKVMSLDYELHVSKKLQ